MQTVPVLSRCSYFRDCAWISLCLWCYLVVSMVASTAAGLAGWRLALHPMMQFVCLSPSLPTHLYNMQLGLWAPPSSSLVDSMHGDMDCTYAQDGIQLGAMAVYYPVHQRAQLGERRRGAPRIVCEM